VQKKGSAQHTRHTPPPYAAPPSQARQRMEGRNMRSSMAAARVLSYALCPPSCVWQRVLRGAAPSHRMFCTQRHA